MKCAILVLNFILVSYIVPDDCDPSPVILPFKLLNENPIRFGKGNAPLNTTQCNNNCVYEKITPWDTIKYQYRSTCLGECCGIYGMVFVECVANIISTDNIQMEDIMYKCHYSKCMNPKSMLNIDRALILQW